MLEQFLTVQEMATRYRELICVGTLSNWRAKRIGPPFLKIGRAILYPLADLQAWERENLVSSRGSKRIMQRELERA
jgi:hypothetical protein